MEEFLKKYHTQKEGLNSSEVTKKRQNQNGLNELKEKKKKVQLCSFRTVH